MRCAAASPPKPPSSACRTKCACASPGRATRSCASACTTSKIWRAACSAISARRPQATVLPRDAMLVARAMGPAELLDYGRDRLRGTGAGRRGHDVACRHRGARHGHAAGRQHQGHHRCRARRRLIVVDGETRRDPFAAASRKSSPPSRRGTTLLAQRVAQIAAVRDLPAVTKDGVRINLMMNAGLLDRHAASGGIRARTASACSAPNCNS